jgi:hypothetical protein
VKQRRRYLTAWLVISGAWIGYWAWKVHGAWTDPCIPSPHMFCLFSAEASARMAAYVVIVYGLGPSALVFVLGILASVILQRARLEN